MLPFAKKTAAALALSLVASAPVLAQSQQVLNFYNWSDYIAEDTINKFEKETGIKVNFDVFDSSELLEAKLLAGNSGYDLVVTPATIIKRHIEAGVYLPLDKQKLPNIKHMHQTFMSTAATQDAGNKHAMPYLWGTTGIGINVDMVKKVLGEDVPLDSWDLVFKPENMKKLASCGVSFLDTADEVYSVALNYLGKNGNSSNKS
ncbi:spermidine/putrescine ABC transporter substrate-binding protein PotF, partial [Bermanella sp. 47_1433_sub80_T6]